MGKIVEFFLNRPILVNLIVITMVGLGIKSGYESQKEGFPEISLNKIIIQTIYPGASARDVELNVTVPIEDALQEVEGIKEIVSVSEESVSRIEVEADNNATPDEFQKLYGEVENALSQVDDLPKEIDGKPVMSEFTSKDIPIMEIAYTGSYKNLKPYIDYIEAKIKKIEGVAFVDIMGLPDQEVQIMVDAVKARRYMVGLRTIAQAIGKRNLEGSGGTLESFTDEKKIVFLSKFKNYRDVLDTNIIMNPEGYGVKLKDVATVSVEPKDMKLIVRNNGKRGATLSIRKTGSSDLIKVIDKINTMLTKENLPAGVEMKVLLDQSSLTRDRISLLVGNALMGFVLVTTVLFMMFNFKTAFWTAFGIPFTLFGMLIFLNTTGISLNLISLAGFIIIIGMLVDDAIVISEEINSNKEKGMEPRKAAIEAVKKMWIPVTGACLTTMVAFTPILSIGGFPGKFVWAIPVMVIVGLLISLFESFFVLPAHLYHGKPSKQEKKNIILFMERGYKKIIDGAVKYRYIVLLFFVALMVLSVFSFKNFVTKDPFPQDAAEGFNIKITLPKGASTEKTKAEVQKFEKRLLALPENELVGFSTRLGTQMELSATERGTQSNIAIIFVYLKPLSNRDRTAIEIMDSLKTKIKEAVNPKYTDYSFNITRIGPPMGKPFEIRVIANDDLLRQKKENEIKEYLTTIDGVYDIETDEIAGKDELDLILNYDMLAVTGLTVEDVLTTLRIAFDGQIVTDMATTEKKIDFRLRLDQKGRKDANFIRNLPILNKYGNLINLKEFVTLKRQPAKAEYHHIDGKRSTTIIGNLDIEKISPVNAMNLVKKKFPGDKKVTVAFSGQPVENELVFGDIGSSAAVALIGIFLLITLILNSFSKPFIIIAPLPFIIIGVTFALLSHGIPISMMGGVAVVGLMGVVVNGSIVMVHTIDDLAEASGITREVITDGAVSRLRPIMLTTVTTILGILPTGYGWGGYDPFLSLMCIVLAYGLLFSTTIVLFLVPILYNIGLDIEKLIHRTQEDSSS